MCLSVFQLRNPLVKRGRVITTHHAVGLLIRAVFHLWFAVPAMCPAEGLWAWAKRQTTALATNIGYAFKQIGASTARKAGQLVCMRVFDSGVAGHTAPWQHGVAHRLASSIE